MADTAGAGETKELSEPLAQGSSSGESNTNSHCLSPLTAAAQPSVHPAANGFGRGDWLKEKRETPADLPHTNR